MAVQMSLSAVGAGHLSLSGLAKLGRLEPRLGSVTCQCQSANCCLGDPYKMDAAGVTTACAGCIMWTQLGSSVEIQSLVAAAGAEGQSWKMGVVNTG